MEEKKEESIGAETPKTRKADKTDSRRVGKYWIGEDSERFETVAAALSHRLRRKILQILANGSFSVTKIAETLDIPATTAHFNIKVLQQAGLVNVIEKVASRGKEHVVSRRVDRVTFDLMMHKASRLVTHTFRLPIASYFEAKIKPPCGMIGLSGVIGKFDDPAVFLLGERQQAQLLWASGGVLEYRIPNGFLKEGAIVQAFSISLELCSEIANYQNDWASDITFFLNGQELCTYTSPGDFGGRRGRLNPHWWSEANTQYGLLVNLSWKENILYLNEVGVATLKPEQLALERGDYFTFSFGVRENAKNYGGFNLFGEKFGDYAQDIVITVDVMEQNKTF